MSEPKIEVPKRPPAPEQPNTRWRISVRGIVQGVGFRPFVYSLARELGLSGWVLNQSSGVEIEIEGPARDLELFLNDLAAKRPPLAVIDSIEATPVSPLDSHGFLILASTAMPATSTPVSPDISLCADCLRELLDPADRRFGYPFINCTNCGPRFTIVRDLPYDRAATTMAVFPMCPLCAAEYEDPANRRFHAQPNACPVCGPHVEWITGTETGFDPEPFASRTEAIRLAQAQLDAGEIIGVKGIGGFHLACEALSDSAVQLLRDRKGRIEQPFALMVRDVAAIKEFAEVSAEEARLLESRVRPIVLLQRRENEAISSRVAPGNNYLGVMLPYAPLHHLLLRDRPLVMTSANASGQPIVRENDEAMERLAGIARGLLWHNREIEVVCDDSVVRSFGGRETPIRRSRGYAPMPVNLPANSPSVLAVGGELKATFCLTRDHFAYLSQHIGDMATLETQAAFERAYRHMVRLFRIEPSLVICDRHPGYFSTRWAGKLAKNIGVPLLQVQHHHAHIAALSLEAGLPEERRVIGISFDGTGYGDDHAIWGGEFLIADRLTFERFAHLRYIPLPGGDSSIKHPARTALAHLWSAGLPWSANLSPVRDFTPIELGVVKRQFERNLNCVRSSSMGRLFDAVASLTGVRQRVNYEGQAAIELEALAERSTDAGAYQFSLMNVKPMRVDPTPVLAEIVSDLAHDVAAGDIGRRFHRAVAEVIAKVSLAARTQTGLNTVCLSGGVFQNVLLLRLAVDVLREHDFEVHWHRVVPANDGGLALGQAAIGIATVASQG